MDVAIKAVESDDELRMATDLMASVHVSGDALAMRWLEAGASQYPGYRREHTRVAMRGHEVLGALRLTTDTIRIGEARLKMGGLGWVSTAPGHRRSGICRRLVEDTLRYMREHGYHVSMLFGIPDFYHRFGYVTALADYSIVVDTLEALTFENPFKTHLAKPGDLAAIQKIHNANDGDTACSLVRSVAHVRNKWARWNEWHVLKDDQGKPVAYLVAKPDGDFLRVHEAGVVEPGVCAAVVRIAAQLAEHEGLARIRFHAPPSHPLARFLGQFRSTHETRIERGAGGMAAFVHLGETLESMIPEWENLLVRSAADTVRAAFTLLVDAAPYRIRANRGAVDVAAVSGPSKMPLQEGDLLHLVAGYRRPDDILDERRCLMTPEARVLFTTLFPKRTPYVWPFDRF